MGAGSVPGKEGTTMDARKVKDGSHLEHSERKIIELGCSNGSTKTAIAETIGKDKSTICKEIKSHRYLACKCSLPLECAAYKRCKHGRNCTIACPDYVLFKCTRRDRSPGVCNGCASYAKCRFDKYRYDADRSDAEYRSALVDSRTGVDLTTSEAQSIAEVAGPLLRQGLSPYMIVKNHPELGICEKTLYNYIEGGVFEHFGIMALDLRFQTSRKIPRHLSANYKKREDRSFLKGRTYKDFQAFMEENPEASVMQMDTVVSSAENGPFLQTFKFTSFPFFFALYHDTKTAADMVAGINLLEQIMGTELFSKFVQVILTDRGTEFSDAVGLETRADGARRTRVYYCDPMQSGQKGSLENNHSELRYILPKGSDFRELGLLGQNDLNLVLSHLNSYPKEAQHGKTYFDCIGFYAHELL